MQYSKPWKHKGAQFKWAFVRHKGKLYKRLMMRYLKKRAKIGMWFFVGVVFLAVATMGVLHVTWMPIHGQLWLLRLFILKG
ncbi:MAG: hypothetical protein [Circoviridae sp.]|jgi:hypothetical protein|nr:MAG: hypothetical protein [Circoviridae sp.]